MDRAAWWATVRRVTKSQTRLSNYTPTPAGVYMQGGTKEGVLRAEYFSPQKQCGSSVENAKSCKREYCFLGIT